MNYEELYSSLISPLGVVHWYYAHDGIMPTVREVIHHLDGTITHQLYPTYEFLCCEETDNN